MMGIGRVFSGPTRPGRTDMVERFGRGRRPGSDRRRAAGATGREESSGAMREDTSCLSLHILRQQLGISPSLIYEGPIEASALPPALPPSEAGPRPAGTMPAERRTVARWGRSDGRAEGRSGRPWAGVGPAQPATSGAARARPAAAGGDYGRPRMPLFRPRPGRRTGVFRLSRSPERVRWNRRATAAPVTRKGDDRWQPS